MIELFLDRKDDGKICLVREEHPKGKIANVNPVEGPRVFFVKEGAHLTNSRISDNNSGADGYMVGERSPVVKNKKGVAGRFVAVQYYNYSTRQESS